MTEYNKAFFDQIIDRKSQGAMKWQRYAADVLPLWVADADFYCAPAILNALKTHLDQGVLGYRHPDSFLAATDAVVAWLKRQHQWQVEPEWLVWVPGVIAAFNMACSVFCEPGDSVLVQRPNYKPLLMAPILNGLQQETVSTVLEGGRWVLDFDELERKAANPRCRLFLLCNPMNPCGTVLNAEEMAKIEAICLRYDVLLCSDELHCDLILSPEAKHIPAGSLPNLAAQTLTIMAANKTFNIAELSTGFVVIPDKTLRQRFQRGCLGTLPWPSPMGVLATEAAFSDCDDWYQGQLNYLRANRQLLVEGLKKHPTLNYQASDATYLAWVDASGLECGDVQAAVEAVGVGPSPGRDFGWNEFFRINFACPRVYIEQAVARLKLLA